VDLDDPAFESLLVGRKVKVLLKDVDLIRWRQDLIEDRNRLATLLRRRRARWMPPATPSSRLREMIEDKCRSPSTRATARSSSSPPSPTPPATCTTSSPRGPGQPRRRDRARHRHGQQPDHLTGLRKDLASMLTSLRAPRQGAAGGLANDGEIDLLIATDCISEGQNLQDCDWLINYDIHWNPVRIIQRFGRIDRIGSPNERIQLVNFWPNMELEEYINLEQRVSGRMVLLDISATGEENLIEQESGNPMNDLEYRRKQLSSSRTR
jgi:hypothetical protein